VTEANVITAIPQIDAYLDVYSDFQKSALGASVPWLRKLRDEGFARFCETGFPTTHDEDWRFTNVSAIAKTQFHLAMEPHNVSPADLEAWLLPAAACRLVFIDGRFDRELSSLGNLPKGVRVASLADEINTNPAGLEAHLGRYLNTQRDAFAALNTAFLADGGFVHIRKSTVLEQPIHLLYVSTATDEPLMTHPRNLIVAEEQSQIAVVEDYVSLSKGGVAFCNTATELVAAESAVVSHYMVERENTDAFNISTLRIQQAKSANLATHSVLLGGGLVRNNVHPVLAGEGSECLINGLFVGNGKQHLDNYMLVEHASPHCDSRQFYNGILDGASHGVFHGRIIVHKDAQKTDAKQTNRNLLLSDDAQIDTKPQLEIYADDVKCTHGATIGQIEENALFYLRSRGIDEAGARNLLLLAFANECLDRMREDSVRDYLRDLIDTHLFAMPHAAKVAVAVEDKGKEKGRNWEEVG
jgi:Fe-S cluster assembly protein SufD